MSLRLMSVGDMLIHMEIVGAAKGLQLQLDASSCIALQLWL